MLSKVVVIGPESTGKSTLSAALARHFGCPWVPEFAREYLERLARPYAYEDLLDIGKGQIRLEDELAKEADDLLLCDTDLHVVQVWSQHRFGKVHPWILEQIRVRKYDLYLLTDIDIPWTDDPLREHPSPEMRQYFFDQYLRLVNATGVPFSIVSGTGIERFEFCVGRILGSRSKN